MPKTSQMRDSKFLKKEDVGDGALMTITAIEQQNVAMEDQEPELKWTMSFKEALKPLVLNSTNIQLCERICGSDDTDDWVGHQVVLYTDPNVSFAGKLVGGIRIRAPKAKKPTKSTPKPVAHVPIDEDDDSDPIPF